MLLDLPVEVLDLILEQISNHKDLKRLSLVSTSLHNITIPHLYRSLIISAPESSIDELVTEVKKIPPKYYKHIQQIGFSVPIHDLVTSRCTCYHGGVRRCYEDGLKGCARGPLFNLACALDLLRISDDQLREFRWEVGTCIPEAHFGGPDSLLSNQRRIRSITLVTEGECGASTHGRYSLNLSQFRELRSLDWRGLMRFNDLESVRECIKAHGHQIESLTLDLLDWVSAERHWARGICERATQPVRTPDNFFSQGVLNMHPQDQNVIFSSLANLHLSAVSFNHTGMGMAHAFNIGRLKSPTLRKCLGSLTWIRAILNYGAPMRLKSLELSLDPDNLEMDANTYLTETVCSFVHHLPNLDNLYLMLPDPMNWNALVFCLSKHQKVHRLVMHRVVGRRGFRCEDGDILWPSHLDRTLQKCQLTCFGSYTPPVDLLSNWREIQPRPSCSLIHLRTSGAILERFVTSCPTSWAAAALHSYKYGEDLEYKPWEIYEFAQWAFGADGIPGLQVLAWGDFSYRGRYSKFNLLLCKSESGYKTLNSSDVACWNLVQDNMDMLAACPDDPLVG